MQTPGDVEGSGTRLYIEPRMVAYPRYTHAPHMGLSITHVVLGLLCIAFNIAAICVNSFFSILSFGIFGGILMIIAGSFGISAVNNQGKCTVITTFVMTIISSVISVGIFVLFSVCLPFDQGYYYRPQLVAVAMDSVLIVLGVAEFIVATVHASYISKAMGICCFSHMSPHLNQLNIIHPGVPQATVGLNQQMYMYIQGQFVPVVANPVTTMSPVLSSTAAAALARNMAASSNVLQVSPSSGASLNYTQASHGAAPNDAIKL